MSIDDVLDSMNSLFKKGEVCSMISEGIQDIDQNCTSHSDCKTGLLCSHSKCYKPAEENEECESYYCYEGICAVHHMNAGNTGPINDSCNIK